MRSSACVASAAARAIRCVETKREKPPRPESAGAGERRGSHSQSDSQTIDDVTELIPSPLTHTVCTSINMYLACWPLGRTPAHRARTRHAAAAGGCRGSPPPPLAPPPHPHPPSHARAPAQRLSSTPFPSPCRATAPQPLNLMIRTSRRHRWLSAATALATSDSCAPSLAIALSCAAILRSIPEDIAARSAPPPPSPPPPPSMLRPGAGAAARAAAAGGDGVTAIAGNLVSLCRRRRSVQTSSCPPRPLPSTARRASPRWKGSPSRPRSRPAAWPSTAWSALW